MRISDWSADVCSSDLKVIAPLTNPAAYGGNPRDAFHVIAPSIPGYGFSDAPTGTGWGVERIAQTWIALIRRLGYDRFVAQGGDWGAAITTAVAMARPPECAAIHLKARKSDVEGKRVSVRVVLGGCRIIKKKKTKIYQR